MIQNAGAGYCTIVTRFHFQKLLNCLKISSMGLCKKIKFQQLLLSAFGVLIILILILVDEYLNSTNGHVNMHHMLKINITHHVLTNSTTLNQNSLLWFPKLRKNNETRAAQRFNISYDRERNCLSQTYNYK